jgi:nucleoside-diphosphate-sugar epimerase
VNALSPAYTEWELVPPLAQSALKLARRTGALLMLPGNVYNFGTCLPDVLVEETPQVADTAKAKIRIELERQMEAAAAHGVHSVVIRAGDFLGGTEPGTWMDMVIARKLGKGEATWLGPLDVPHAWAFLPDLARVFVAVAARRAELRPFEVFHYGGLTLTGREFLAALECVAGRTLKVKQMPWWLLKLASPFVPLYGALLKMRYLWQRPHRLEDGKLRGLIGTLPCTPIDQVLRDSLPAEVLAPNTIGRSPFATQGRAARG